VSAPVRRTRRRRELSQHFLRRGALAASLVEASTLERSDLVIEVGAGRGALTRELARRAGHVVAVEVDPELCRELCAARRAWQGGERVEIVCADFLELELPRRAYKVFGSLPFARTTDSVRRLTHARRPPEDAWLVVQREAARRFAGAPWGPETLLSLQLKPGWQIEILRALRPVDFDPPPAVQSALIWLARRGRPLVVGTDHARYRELVSNAFARGGPGLRAALRPELTPRQLERLARELGFDPGSRPSALRFEQWLALFRFISSNSSGVRRPRLARRRGTP
jgi:23S rRNA (adenine-N6)-dimethyltransferase